jgi:hypothetical protein
MAKKPTTINTLVLSDADKALLQAIVTDTASAAGFRYVPQGVSTNLVAAGLVEINPAVSNADGIGTRATPKGIETLNTNETPVATASNVAAGAITKPTFTIDSGVALPNIKRNSGGNGSKSAYPFDALELNQSFHVPADGNNKLPRVIAAAVSNANARYAKPTGQSETVEVTKYQLDASGKRVKVDGHFVKLGKKSVTRPQMKAEREFALRTVDANDIRGPGIRVFRIA